MGSGNGPEQDLQVRTLALAAVDWLREGQPRQRARTRETLRLIRAFEAGNSAIWVFRRHRRRPGVVVKEFQDEQGMGYRAERECRTLARLADHFSSSPTLHVPPPVYHDGQRILVTREVIGTRLDRFIPPRLRWSAAALLPHRTTEAVSACTLIGQWLKTFQQLPASHLESEEPSESLTARLLDRYDQAEERVRASDSQVKTRLPFLRNHFRQSIMEALSPAATVPHHSDFSLHNMILARDGLYVLDVSEVGFGHPCEAVAFFWAALETLRTSRRYAGSRIERCQAAFVRAATGVDDLPRFWQQWGMFMRLSYRPAGGKGIRGARHTSVHRRLSRWLQSQPLG